MYNMPLGTERFNVSAKEKEKQKNKKRNKTNKYDIK